MECKKCGMEIINGISFCTFCGTPVEKEEKLPPKEEIVSEEKEATPKSKFSIHKDTIIIGLVSVFTFFVIFFVSTFFVNHLYGLDEDKEMTIGSKELGYLTLVGNWKKDKKNSDKNKMQYIKGEKWTISLKVYSTKKSKKGAQAIAEEDYAEIAKGSKKVENLSGALVKVGEYDAYQIYCYYTEEKLWLVEWFFETEDEKVRFISVQGADKQSDYFKVPNTFSLKK